MKTKIHTQFYKVMLLAALLVAIALPCSAYDFMVDGIAYGFVSNDSTAVQVEPISKTEYYTGDIVVPATVEHDGKSYNVTAIGMHAFTFSSGMTSIELPSSIKTIEPGAFMNCYGLTSIDLPEGLESIGNLAFVACENLETVTIPSTVQDIGYMAFNMNSKLRKITIPEGVEVIKYMTFSECHALKDVVLPQSLKAIGTQAFSNCKQFSMVVIPDAVVEIGNEAFNNCENVTEITIGKGVKNISSNAFNGCTRMEVVKWNAVACEENEGDFQSPFKGNMFAVVIGNEVQRIPAQLFNYAYELGSIDIPASVKEIGNNAFENCLRLSTIVSRNPDPNLISYGSDLESIFNGVNKEKCVVWVPAGTIDVYKATMPWSQFEDFREIVDGDINCDGAVTAADVMMQYNRVLNSDYSQPATCDVDGDGSITSADVTTVYNILLGN